MEDKKVKKIIIIVLVSSLLCLLSLFLGSDISQYKRIGKTNFFIWEDFAKHTIVYMDDNSDIAIGIIDRNVRDVFWDERFILAECSEWLTDTLTTDYYIINLDSCMNDSNKKIKGISSFNCINNYSREVKLLGLQKDKMRHTNGDIPWRLIRFR